MSKIFNNLEVYGTGTTNDSNAIRIFNSNNDELFSVSNSGITSAKTINVESLKLVTQGNTRGYLLTSDEQGTASWSPEQNLTLWPLVVQGNRLIDGSVSYVSGLTFEVTTLKYIIDGQIYTSTVGTVVLESGSTQDRVDVIYANTSGLIGSISGTPSPNPEKPIVDSNTQVEVTFVSIPANSATPTISTKLIYDEKVGQPTEWNFLPFGSQSFRISGDSTLQSYSGTKSISVSGITTSGGSYSNGFILSATTATDTNQFATLQFAIRNMSGNSTNTYVLIQFLGQTGNVLNGSSVWIYGGASSGQYVNYVSTNTTSWQLISIPLWRFYLNNTNVYGIKFSYQIGSTVARHYFDKIELVEGSASSPPTNNWLNVRGDATTLITPTTPNSTLIISGGTNIGTTVTSPNRVNINLDNNITLNGVTATGSMIYSGAFVTRRFVFQGTITNAGVDISHNLNVNYVVVQVYDNSSPYKLLAGAEILIVDNNTINIKVSVSAIYNVIIIG